MTDEEKRELVIPREKAAFRLDRRGRWRNAHGPFRNPRIIAYFDSAIQRDAGGYYVGQQRDGWFEKVYFPYEDTALFVRDVILGEDVTLVLNTKKQMRLEPTGLFILGDCLYVEAGGERIKFTERAMLRLADLLEFTGGAHVLKLHGRSHTIPERPPASEQPPEETP
jgi:hypothetical protein